MNKRRQIEDLEDRVTALEEVVDFLLNDEDEIPDDEMSEDEDEDDNY